MAGRDNAAAVRDTLTALMDELRKANVTFKAKNEYLQELKKVTDVTAGKYDLSTMYPPDEFAKTSVTLALTGHSRSSASASC